MVLWAHLFQRLQELQVYWLPARLGQLYLELVYLELVYLG